MDCRGDIDHIRFGPTEADYQRWEIERGEAIDKMVARILKGVKENEMSWSINLIGTPEGVGRKLDEYAETLTGQSREEFMDAKPHLQGLLSQTVKQNVRLSANGHATFASNAEGTQSAKTYGSVNVSLENFYGEWAE